MLPADQRVLPVANALRDLVATVVPCHLGIVGELAARPVAILEMPDMTRKAPDVAESQLGSNDWDLMFPLCVYCDLDDPNAGQQYAVGLASEIIELVDAWDKTIPGDTAGGILDAKVTEARVSYDHINQSRPLIAYEMQISVWRLIF